MKPVPIRELMPFRVLARWPESENSYEFPVDVYALVREPSTGELLVITADVGGSTEYVVSTWNGLRVCAGNTVEAAARAALKRIRKSIRAGRDLPSALSIQSGIVNQLPVMPLRPEWFALPEQIAAFGKDGQIVLDALDYIERGLLLSVRRGNGVLDACGSISHALFELRRDPAAKLSPWGTVGAETDTGAHRADLADQIMGLQQWTTITDRPPTETDGDRRGLVLALRPGHGWELMRWCGAAALRLRWMQLPPIPEGAS